MKSEGVKKGDRVKILEGKGCDQHGEVFWTGPNKWGAGLRLGVRGDDGETYWVGEADTEPSTERPPAPEPAESFEKGDRVAFTQRGQQGEGTVFWTGQGRTGGQRLGVRPDDSEDAVWLDARFASRAAPPAPAAPAAPAAPREPPVQDGDGYTEYAPSLGPDDLPPMAPLDDAYVDQMASTIDEDSEVAPYEW